MSISIMPAGSYSEMQSQRVFSRLTPGIRVAMRLSRVRRKFQARFLEELEGVIPPAYSTIILIRMGRIKTTISGIWSGQQKSVNFNQIAFSLIHGIRVSTTWNWSGLWNGTGVLASNPTGLWIRIIRIIAKYLILKSLQKAELSTCANTVSSRFSELFTWMEMLNIGQQISSMHQNQTGNCSKNLGGTSKCTIEVLSSVAESRDARDAKKLFNEVTFFFHYWLFFAWKLSGWIRVSAGTSRNVRLLERQLPSLSRNRLSNPILFCRSYDGSFSIQANSTA